MPGLKQQPANSRFETNHVQARVFGLLLCAWGGGRIFLLERFPLDQMQNHSQPWPQCQGSRPARTETGRECWTKTGVPAFMTGVRAFIRIQSESLRDGN
jgi:hypothetical protein